MCRWLSVCCVTATALTAGCAPPGEADDAPAVSLSPTARGKIADAVLAQLALGTPQRLLVVVAAAADATPAARAAYDAGKAELTATALDHGAVIDDTWDQLPILPVTVASLDALAALLEDPRVVSASPIQVYQTFDAESFPLIGQPAAAAAGRIGTGASVAVLDTGTDYLNPAFGCTAPGVPAACKVAVARDFATEDNSRDANGHGTNVSGIVVGVAPGARVLALDVFDGASAGSDRILAAYNWVLQNRTVYNIASVNLSLGGGSATAPCAGDPLAVAFATGRTAGVVTAVASGNNGFLAATAWPACAPAAVSVGAVYDANLGGLAFSTCSDPVTAADRVTCFSNSAPFLSLLAPGALIDAAGIRMAGTSQASPHVAGAVAVLHAAFPADTGLQLISRLVTSGRPVTDARNGRVTPRLDLARAVALTPTPPGDTTPPTGSVLINANATYTASAAVTLTLAATDASGVASVCLGEPCGAFVPYATTLATTLAAGANGTRTVVVRFKDAAGNVSAPVSDTIVLDTVAPSLSLTVTEATAQVRLQWTAVDATAGVASYKVVAVRSATAPPAACTTGTVLATGTANGVTHGPLVVGESWAYRLCATDRAGNVSPGISSGLTVR